MKSVNLPLAEELGAHLSDGCRAAEFRMRRIRPCVGICDKIVLDFTGVRNANSSFVNSLVAGTIEDHGPNVMSKLTFKGCNAAIQVLVEAAVFLGMSKGQRRVA